MGTFTHSTGDVDIETGGDEDRGGEGEQEEEGEVVHDEARDDFLLWWLSWWIYQIDAHGRGQARQD